MRRKGLILGMVLLSITVVCTAMPMDVVAIHGTQEAKLVASDSEENDSFGFSVSIDGHKIVVGAKADDDAGIVSGSAYVFERSGAGWNQQAKLIASDAVGGENFGQSVAMNNSTIVVGAWLASHSGHVNAGAAYVFEQTGTNWSQQQKLVASDAAQGDKFGQSVAIDGDTIAVGAIGGDAGAVDSGAAYLFQRSGTTWNQQAKLIASDGAVGDNLGYSIAIEGDYVVVGARYDDDGGTHSGSAYVFHWNGTAWTQQAKLVAGDAAAYDEFGVSVAIHGNIIVVGAYQPGSTPGAVYVFERSGSSWSQQTKLTASDGAINDQFGISVSIDGDIIVVGSRLDDDGGVDAGSAYVFQWNGTSWIEEAKLTANDAAGGEWFGWSVSIKEGTTVIGAYRDDNFTGSAYVFGLSTPSVSEINDYIQDLPSGAFDKNPNQRKNALSHKLDAVMDLIAECRYAEAIDKLRNDIRAKADGTVGGNPKDDWITDPQAQVEICAMIDALIAYLETLPPCPVYCSEAAAAHCAYVGWTVVLAPPSTSGDLICTIDGRPAEENCGGCGEYNIVVWENGAGDPFCPLPGSYTTFAGNIYCGHNPCECGDNLIWCGVWDMQDCTPDP